MIMGIDPGQTGAFVCLWEKGFAWQTMPTNAQKEIDFEKVIAVICHFKPSHIFLERAMPLAMGAKHAFNYGRGFATLELAIKIAGGPVTYVEPAKWVKVLHAGIDSRLKPKAKSVIAVKRLFPKFWGRIPVSPKAKNPHEGVIDALLIAEYGRRILKG